MRRLTMMAALAAAVAGCQTTTGTPAVEATVTPAAASADTTLQGRLSGKTLVNDVATIALTPSGELVGKITDGPNLLGAWTVRQGQFCRTLAEPEGLAGTQCQDVAFEGSTVTLTSASGAAESYTVK